MHVLPIRLAGWKRAPSAWVTKFRPAAFDASAVD
jgi:hypothetical protein